MSMITLQPYHQVAADHKGKVEQTDSQPKTLNNNGEMSSDTVWTWFKQITNYCELLLSNSQCLTMTQSQTISAITLRISSHTHFVNVIYIYQPSKHMFGLDIRTKLPNLVEENEETKYITKKTQLQSWKLGVHCRLLL